MASRSLGTLTLDLVAKIGGFEQGMDKAARISQQRMKKIKGDADGVSEAFSRLATRAGGALAAAFSVRQLVQYADEWTNINNRLMLVTDSTEQLTIAQEDIFRIAQDSRQSLSASAELYQRIATNAAALGLSLNDVSGVVETISQTLAISGASAQGASAALVQLGQAFASGTLRGEELNSVLEQAPALAQAIAKGMGVSVGQLRELGKAGELTSQSVIDALKKMSDSVQSDFDKTTGTVGQAFQKLQNSLVVTVGRFDDATGASNIFAEAISGVADAIGGIGADEITQLRGQLEALEGINTDGGFWKWMTDLGSQDTAQQIADVRRQIEALVAARDAIGSKVIRDEIISDVEVAPSKEFAKRQAQLEKEIALIDQAGKAAELRYEIENNMIDGLLPKEGERLIARQQELEALKQGKKFMEEQAKASEQLQSAFEGQLDVYAREMALVGEVTELERIRYEIAFGALRGIGDEMKKNLEARAKESDALKESIQLEEDRKKLQEEVASLTAGLRTEEEAALDSYIESMNTLNKAQREGIAILGGYDDASRRVFEKYQKDIEKAAEDTGKISVAWDEALRGIQGHLADYLFDPFQDGIDGMLDGFLTVLRRMAAEAAAAQIMDSIFGAAGQGGQRSGGPDWASLAASFAGFFDTGGMIGTGQFGVVGENGPELVRGPAMITSRADTAKMMGGNSVSIGNMVFPNVTDSRQAQEAAGAAARQMERLVNSGRRYS